MDLDRLFMSSVGYEKVGGERFRIYVDGPLPTPHLRRPFGVRSPLFYLFAGLDVVRIEAWLARHRAWQCLRIPTFNRFKGVRAVLTAERWRGGDGSALSDLGRDRIIRDEDHRDRLRTEAEWLLKMVLENPVRDDELVELHDLQDVINAGPVGVELASTAEIMTAYFESV